MKKIVIVGAGGFIGSALKNSLERNEIIPLYKGDLNLLSHQEVTDFLTGVKPDVVINTYTAGGRSNVKATDLSIVSDNLIAFDNFRRNKHLFGRYINIGSGAEFTKTGLCHEDDILTSTPSTSYGLSKNLISRMCLQEPNFYILRLFGCFGVGEPDFRLFTKFMSSTETMDIDDKYFDNISVNDFIKVVHRYVISTPPHKDVNCVNPKKLLISEQLKLLSEVTSHSRPLVVKRGVDYVGSATRLKSLGLTFDLATTELEKYKCLKLYM